MRERNILREIGWPIMAAALVPALSVLDRPNWGPHTVGFMILGFPAAGIAAMILGAFALKRRRWLRALAFALLFAACLLGRWMIGPIPACPECG